MHYVTKYVARIFKVLDTIFKEKGQDGFFLGSQPRSHRFFSQSTIGSPPIAYLQDIK